MPTVFREDSASQTVIGLTGRGFINLAISRLLADLRRSSSVTGPAISPLLFR
ncbi:hypothetical protein ABER99_06935 [Paenibacillus glucanolyticus]|uniref:hypothetical protein n=1 Tax=Paenibacillus glucanolyticus TaxID=59843 RepID=UPI0012DC9B45|nr:hypothetical protein [Paenibacillus glucanolyticus]